MADGKEWEEMQKRTFTRWCNECLKERNIVIHDLATDLSDGLKLIALYEVLAKKQVKRYNKNPKRWAQKRDNIHVALKRIKNENIKLVSIGKLSFLYCIYSHASLENRNIFVSSHRRTRNAGGGRGTI